MPRVNGVSEEKRRLLATVAESMVLYAAPVWGDMALRTAVNRRCLRSAQRSLAIRVSRAYRTVATDALLVLARTLPWDLLAGERSLRYLEQRNLDLTEARKATINKWQEEWTMGEVRPGRVAKGCWTRSLIPDLGVWLKSKGELTYYTTQVLSGHGQFQTYMVKIGKSDSDVCVLCDSREADDVAHTVLRCPSLGEVRQRAPRAIQNRLIPEMVCHMMTSAEAWKETTYCQFLCFVQ